MKKLVLFFVIDLLCLAGYSQPEYKLSAHSASASLGLFGNEGFSGLSAHVNFTLKSKKMLYGFALSGGQEVQLFGGPASGYTEFNLLVGKDFRVVKWLNFECLTGVGIIEFSSNGRYLQSGIAVGLPAVVNTKFNFNKHFGFGIGCFVNFSQITFNYAVSPMFHYRF